MSFLTRNRIAGLMIAAVIAIADQAVKRWVVVDLGLTHRGDPIVPPDQGPGMAFSHRVRSVH